MMDIRKPIAGPSPLRRVLYIGLPVLGIALLAATVPADTNAAPQSAGAVERGKYLVAIGGCNDCHTPFKMGPNGPEPDMSKMLSGHPASFALPAPPKLNEHWMWAGSSTNTAFVGPWGISYAPNLSPDEETGVGAWDDALFIAAIRNGKIMGAGRPIMPPMPWQGYAQMTDEDLKAIFAYLHSIPPIKNQVPEYVPPPKSGGAGSH